MTGSALVVHPASHRVLLRWHTKMGQWMQVGGHFDPGETDPLQVALREGLEETGLDDLRPVASARGPVQIVIVPVPAHGDEPAHEHADFRYVFVTDRPDAIREESSAARLRWMSFTTAGAETREPNLHTFLAGGTRDDQLIGPRPLLASVRRIDVVVTAVRPHPTPRAHAASSPTARRAPRD